ILKDGALYNLALDFMRNGNKLASVARDLWFEMNERGIRECADWPIAIEHVLYALRQIETSAEAQALGERRRQGRA
ncbi:hypothetical protein SB690_20610, partial [Bacillus sp. SIMBA_006]